MTIGHKRAPAFAGFRHPSVSQKLLIIVGTYLGSSFRWQDEWAPPQLSFE